MADLNSIILERDPKRCLSFSIVHLAAIYVGFVCMCVFMYVCLHIYRHKHTPLNDMGLKTYVEYVFGKE